MRKDGTRAARRLDDALTKEERRVEIKKLNKVHVGVGIQSDTRQLDESQLRLMHVFMGQLGYLTQY